MSVFNIGVDEISYKRGHQYLTVVADHDTGRVLHVAKGRNQAALQSFFDLLGPNAAPRSEPSRMDMATHLARPLPAIDPPGRTSASTRSTSSAGQPGPRRRLQDQRPLHGTGTGDRRLAPHPLRPPRRRRTTRTDHHALLRRLRRTRYALWRAWDLKERLRDLYRDHRTRRRPRLPHRWCRSANAAASRPSSTSPARSAATSTASSPPSNTACPTAASKASTPRSASSTAAATATPTPNTSPP